MSDSDVHFVPAQPGLKLTLVLDNEDFDKGDKDNFSLIEQPLVAWRISTDGKVTPVGAGERHEENVFARYIEGYPYMQVWILADGRYGGEMVNQMQLWECLKYRLEDRRKVQKWKKEHLRVVTETRGSKGLIAPIEGN